MTAHTDPACAHASALAVLEPAPVGEWFDTVEDWWTCVCGNDAMAFGFVPAFPNGETVEPDRDGPWDGCTLVCRSCGRIGREDQADHATGRVPVVGRTLHDERPRCSRLVARRGWVGACDRVVAEWGDDCPRDDEHTTHPHWPGERYATFA